ncbi:MAG: histidine kinase [Hymenobacteraceae bacterium]|nr:histidine kinase [Hymenobacteraceae bacterium]MDX5395285.1 histidine kinase [Hymenobacteraceae bacterium]MDX5444105.1 histidine kinase [Hymenobacteraceae bacterium]MDX5511321.1 histidine kinase [Hymenobacteraceae bacterium]
MSKKKIARYAANCIISFMVFWVFFFIHRSGLSEFTRFDVFRIFYSMVMGNVLLEGSRSIARRLSRKYDWRVYGIKRFTYEWLAVQTYILLTMALFEILPRLVSMLVLYKTNQFDLFKEADAAAVKEMKVVFVFGSMLFLFIHFIRSGIFFYNQWHKSLLKAEKLQKENAIAHFESLKNQVNPHFLFNSLNALSTLIYKDQDTAAKFVDQLSKVYRYVLENKDKELVKLKTELDFIESYLFLLKIRFRDNLLIHLNIPAHYLENMVAPLTLQMLIENAIKHNIVSRDEPLCIEIFVDEAEHIVIKNNLQRRHHHEGSTGLGLKNIVKRYSFITSKKVDIQVTATDFIAKLPLLTTYA